MSHLTLFMGLGLAVFLIIFLPLILMIYCLVDIARSNFKDTTHKLLWVLIVLLFPFFGSLVYLVLGRSQRL